MNTAQIVQRNFVTHNGTQSYPVADLRKPRWQNRKGNCPRHSAILFRSGIRAIFHKWLLYRTIVPARERRGFKCGQSLRHVASSLPCKSTVMKSNVRVSRQRNSVASLWTISTSRPSRFCLAPLSSASIVVTEQPRLCKNCSQMAARRTDLQSRTPRISARNRANSSCAVRMHRPTRAPPLSKIAEPDKAIL